MAAYESHEPPPSSSSSLSRRWRYDVFLSYYIWNTGVQKFANRLRRAMIDAEVNVYVHHEVLRAGNDIGESLLEAIKYSRISVIIFSEQYADSRWCLAELAKIMECRTTFQQRVISMIYKVGKFHTKADIFERLFEAFTSKGCSNSDTMSSRRNALTEAKNLSAFEYREGLNRNMEGEFIDSFLKSILGVVDGGANRRQIGNLFVSNKEIAKGSNGTIVFEGTYSGRLVAVKRLLKALYDVAFKEIQILIESDEHQNIVRLYGEENDQDFVYLALQQCTCNLDDLIQIYSDNSQNTPFSDKYNKGRLDSVKHIIGDINLWKANGRPSPLLLELMRNMVAGLVHLHKLKIIHRDIKPHNVLIKKEETLLAKLSDMGISKRLDPGESSLGLQATVCGTPGWKAPERFLEAEHGSHQTSALDLFGLGCVLFFCITGGRHPFGDHFERDYNIVKNRVDLSAVEYIPEAVDLFSHLLNPHPELRPKASEVLHHPLLWDSEKRLSFVRDTSDLVELKAKESNSNGLLKELENIEPLIFDADWDTKMDAAFIANIGRTRYKFHSVRDLLRVMRNKWTHYVEFPDEIKEILGPVPEGYDHYFASRFPKLLIEVYKVVGQYCKKDERLQEYLKFNV